jgi:hypothetical protein
MLASSAMMLMSAISATTKPAQVRLRIDMYKIANIDTYCQV